MSFSDFGRTSMAALTPMVAAKAPQPSQSQSQSQSVLSKSCRTRRFTDQIPPRRSGKDCQDGTHGRRSDSRSSRDVGIKPPSLGSQSQLQSSRRRRSDGGAITTNIADAHKHKNKNALEIHRGVRPRLDHIQCPVTQKTLMEDVDASLASTSISSSTTNRDEYHDTDDDDDGLYSDSDIGLNHSASTDRDEARRRNHRSSGNRSSSSSSRNARRNYSNNNNNNTHIDGRKGERQDSRSSNTPQQRGRRLPKHYNNISETAVDRGRNTTTHTKTKSKSKQRSHSVSKTRGVNNRQIQGNYNHHHSNPNLHPKQASASPSSKLSTEIAQFQKMAADLETSSRSSALSPEAMWKSRILLRSAQDADKDLKLKLALEQEIKTKERDATVGGTVSVAAAAKAASLKKLQRDYHRASEQLRKIIEATERRQKAEISCLTASEAAAIGANTTPGEGANAAATFAHKRTVNAEEDFFDRAMRERQAEVQKISESMKKVQNIYTDLAGLVDGQQDQIDQLEDINEGVKADTRAGLEEIQLGMWKLCAAKSSHPEMGANGDFNGNDNGIHQENQKHRNTKKKIVDPSDILNCMMACHALPEQKSDGPAISLDGDLYHETTISPNQNNANANSNANYYKDDHSVSASSSGWKLPKFEHVQETAQDAYDLGHAMVGGIVGQVHEVVASGEGLREVGNRISCTPQPEEYSSSDTDIGDGDGDHDCDRDGAVSNGIRLKDTHTANGCSDENHYRGEGFHEERPRRHSRREDQRKHTRTRSHQSSHKHQHGPEPCEEDDYNEASSKRERRKGRHHGQRRKS